jgi:preprotein translocase subunit SecG
MREPDEQPLADGSPGEPSDAALLDAFRARLEKEGGANNLRLSTDAGRLRRAAGGAADGLKSALDLDQSKSAPSVSGRLLDKENWTLTVAFLGLVIALSCFTAFRTPQPGDQVSPQQQAGRQTSGTVDSFTSDGGALMFGRR